MKHDKIKIDDGLSAYRSDDRFVLDDDEGGSVSFEGENRAVLVAKCIEVLADAEGEVELDLSNLEITDKQTA